MLKLENIKKDYITPGMTVHALKGLTLNFRKNEFVSVLGPSGCGKTTLLNIVGGLDKYTSGNLYISGKSTREFGDRDWDVYRNHRIGFVFQSYNLIPHQSVLKNVELALTIAGMSKEARVQKAKSALIKVGLESEMNKRPNQLSGGQSQRVAIARALVNDPEILLADEPTGALDTETSKQILDLIKEIARERLVIMVTHNPELADKYSTRIIRLLDGNLLSDSKPFSDTEEAAETTAAEKKQAAIIAEKQAQTGKKHKKERAKMSFLTALKLSLNNLFSKKARTIMISIAGSIGIIGVSLVLSFSYGIKQYISNMQDDMLSGNPVTISQTQFDMSSMMGGGDALTKDEKKELEQLIKARKEDKQVSINSMIGSLYKRSSLQVKNEINDDYIKYLDDIPSNYAASVFYDYGVDVTNNIYTDFQVKRGTDAHKDNISISTIRNIYTYLLKQEDTYKEFASLVTSITNVFRPLPIGEDYIKSQYEVLEGKVATDKNEIMIVVNSQQELNDLLFAQLGYLAQDEFIAVAQKAVNQKYDETMLPSDFSYRTLMDKTFTWYPNDVVYNNNMSSQTVSLPFTYNPKSDSFAANSGQKLRVVGILTPKENMSYGSLSSGFYYTQALTEHIMTVNKNLAITNFTKTIGGNLGCTVEQGIATGVLPLYSFKYNGQINPDTGKIDLASGDRYLFDGVISTRTTLSFESVPFDQSYQLGFAGSDANSFDSVLSIFGMGGGGDDVTKYYYTLSNLGGGTLPVSISIYSRNFEEKKLLLSYLDRWNSSEDITLSDGTKILAWNADRNANGEIMLDENGKPINPVGLSREKEIKYSDTLSLIIDMINQLINIITVALVGFTSLALFVSCVMIAIITYVSVVERIKEIGVIRSLGGRKRDVSNLFTAETGIIGLSSGLIGVLFTYLASFVINLIVKPIIGLNIAVFPLHYAIIMVCVSVGLTLISGLFPSGAAARKDPVVALRTE